jgi:hypothetical protein
MAEPMSVPSLKSIFRFPFQGAGWEKRFLTPVVAGAVDSIPDGAAGILSGSGTLRPVRADFSRKPERPGGCWSC